MEPFTAYVTEYRLGLFTTVFATMATWGEIKKKFALFISTLSRHFLCKIRKNKVQLSQAETDETETIWSFLEPSG